MNIVRTILVSVLGGLMSLAAEANIMNHKSLGIDFTNAVDANAKATWSEPDKLNITQDGLGRDGETASMYQGWIQTIPLAIGLSWRPPAAVYFSINIDPKPQEYVLDNGQKTTPYVGNVYVRYSPDTKHWSTWQVLERSEPQSKTEQENPGRYFSGRIQVPIVARELYSALITKYAKLDVPWKSDEDAAVRWILQSSPDFFVKNLPFIGYVQFRYEGEFFGGQRIKSFKAFVGYGMSGLHSAPKDENAYKDRDARPWSFQENDKEPNPESCVPRNRHTTYVEQARE